MAVTIPTICAGLRARARSLRPPRASSMDHEAPGGRGTTLDVKYMRGLVDTGGAGSISALKPRSTGSTSADPMAKISFKRGAVTTADRARTVFRIRSCGSRRSSRCRRPRQMADAERSTSLSSIPVWVLRQAERTDAFPRRRSLARVDDACWATTVCRARRDQLHDHQRSRGIMAVVGIHLTDIPFSAFRRPTSSARGKEVSRVDRRSARIRARTR